MNSPSSALSRHATGTMRALAVALVALAACWLGTVPASAHPAETTAVLVTVHEDTVELEIQLPVRQYIEATGADLDVDGADVEENAAELVAYAADRLALSDADGALEIAVDDTVSEATVNDLPTAIITVTATPADGSVDGDLTLDYSLLIDRVATHDVYVSLVSDWQDGTLTDEEAQLVSVLDWETTEVVIERGSESFWSGVSAAVHLGAVHIAEGPDHMLFVAMLLVPVPLVAAGRRWSRTAPSGRTGLRGALRRAAVLVTAFTVGHTVSLALVSTGVISPPVVLTESLVALSIVAAALHAWRPFVRRGEAWVAAGFGLVHGTAFATTLVSLGLAPGALAAAIVAFNIGVEVAQLVIVLAVLPPLLWAARSPWYAAARPALALAGGIAGMAWLVAVLQGGDSVLSPAFAWVVEEPFAAYLAVLAVLSLVAIGPTLVGAARRSGAPDERGLEHAHGADARSAVR